MLSGMAGFGEFRTGEPSVVRGVPAGRHVVAAAGVVESSDGNARQFRYAETELIADGGDDVVSLELVGGRRVTGRFVFDGEAPATDAPVPVLVALFPTDPRRWLSASDSESVTSGSGFVIPNVVPGQHRLWLRGLPAPWRVFSAVAGDVDLLDHKLPVETGRVTPEIVVTLTSRETRLSGSVVDVEGRPRHDATVVVFPNDPGRRTIGSRRIGVAQPDIDGRYQLAGLPPGDYLAVAAPIGWDPIVQPDLLIALASSAQRVTLRLGEPVTAVLTRRD
jgi:hypothetical protein